MKNKFRMGVGEKSEMSAGPYNQSPLGKVIVLVSEPQNF